MQLQMPRLTPVVKWLIIASASLFLLQLICDQFFQFSLFPILGFAPFRLLSGWIWQPFTYAFLHAGMMHILFNMLILWTIGSELESLWGSRLFAVYFIVCVLGAALAFAVLGLAGVGGGVYQPVVGSSGGVYGLLVAYGILFGNRILYFFMLFPIEARYFVMLLGGIELVSSIFFSHQGIAHIAHLGGMLSGFGFLAAMAKWRSRERGAARQGLKDAEDRQRRLRNASHLKLVGGEDDKGPKHWH